MFTATTLLAAGSYALTRFDLDETEAALILERARTDHLAEEIKQLHDALQDTKRRAGQISRRAETEGADGCPVSSFRRVFELQEIPEGWHVVDAADTELRSWARGQASVKLVPGTPYSQDATPRHRAVVLDSFGWVGRIDPGYSVEFTYGSCAFSFIGEGVTESEIEAFANSLRAP